MKKVIFLEGLPGVGKTTIISKIAELKLDNVHVVNEIIKDDIVHNKSTQLDFALNDDMKVDKYKDGTIVIDRGPISTLSYNQTRSLINESFDSSAIENWFKKYEDFYQSNDVYAIYFTTNKTSYQISENDFGGPYGSIKNQQMLEEITLNNCKKYCRNLKVIEYHKDNMMEVINEIIS